MLQAPASDVLVLAPEVADLAGRSRKEHDWSKAAVPLGFLLQRSLEQQQQHALSFCDCEPVR